MTDDEIKALDKEVRKLKRIASEWASQMHDLVEDRLPAAYQEIPALPNPPSMPARRGPTRARGCRRHRPKQRADHDDRTDPRRDRMDPQFVTNLDQEKCIGCGRCYKVCPRNVLDLVERELADDDDDEDDDNMMVMAIADAMDCIGCGACGRVCPKDCYTYAPA